MINFIRKSLLGQLVGAFSALSLVSLVVAASTAYVGARQSLRESVYERLQVSVALKEYDVVRWFESQRQDTVLLAQAPGLKLQASILASTRRETPEFQAAYRAVQRYFREITLLKTNFRDMSLLTAGGIVLVSTDAAQEGTYQALGNLSTYFESGQFDIVPNFYKSPITGQFQITLATPITDGSTGRGAVLAVNLNLKSVDDVIRERTGLGRTGQTYLVGQSPAGDYIFFSGAQPDDNDVFSQGINSFGIDRAMEGEDGEGAYRNYADIPVLGVYRWVNSQNLALMGEINQAEAFLPATILARNIIALGVGSAAVLIALVYGLTVQLMRPIRRITDTAAAIEANDFQLESLDAVKHRPDELGQLARVFQRMAEQIYEREKRLKQQVAELKIEIDQAKRAKQVAEVTDTDYFRDLQKRSKALRSRFRRERPATMQSETTVDEEVTIDS